MRERLSQSPGRTWSQYAPECRDGLFRQVQFDTAVELMCVIRNCRQTGTELDVQVHLDIEDGR